MMKGSMSTDLGIITINPEVIAKYAGSMAIECFGIVGMAAVNMKDGLVHLLKRESLTRGIHVEITEDNVITLDFHVIVSYGVNILSVSDNLMNNVKYKVEEFTGMEIKDIRQFMDWCVEGSSTYPQRKALFEEQRSHMEAELEQMNRTLDMLKFKCWYYEQAIKDGSEDRLKSLIPDHLPEEIRKAYENAHS